MISLTSADTNEIVLPANVTLPTGQTNVTVTLASLDEGNAYSSETLTVTASATNYASGSDAMTETDSGLPDLLVTDISAPRAVFTSQPLAISFELVNQGLGGLTNSVTQNVYLTTDPVSGVYLLWERRPSRIRCRPAKMPWRPWWFLPVRSRPRARTTSWSLLMRTTRRRN